LAAWIILALLALWPMVAAAGPTTQSAPRSFDDYIHSRIDTALTRLRGDGNFAAASTELSAVCDQVVGFAPEKDAGVFRDADFARRLVAQLSQLDGDAKPGELLAYLLQNPVLAHNLVFLFQAQYQKPQEVYGTLAKLRAHAGAKLETYATLGAAICLVHQSLPLTRQLNENIVEAPDPCAIFDYFVQNESRMLLGIEHVPAEVLLYVVDTTSPIDQMTWALGRYAGNPSVGDLYFNIKYDTSHLLRHTEKKVTELGYTLPNILQYGGVCVDQAYFTTEVGKAIGVPTVYITARDADAGHAYAGYLRIDGDKATWRVDIGRFGDYAYLHGVILDPQTRRAITDSDLALTAETFAGSSDDRQAAAALTDAAARLLRAAKDPRAAFAPGPPTEKVKGALSRARLPNGESALALLEAGLTRCPGYAPGWLTMARAAAEGQMSLEQKRRWAGVIERFLVGKYPDFAFSLLAPMVRTVAGSADQNALWNRLFTVFQSHPDLAAAVRVEQAAMWRGEGQTALAGQCYEDVFNRFANAGPFVLDALRGAEQLLKATDQTKVPLLYERVWTQIKPPQRMAPEFMAGSVWLRVGKLLVNRLQTAGMNSQAELVKSRIESYMSGSGER
jgi:hypothetical protein